MVLIGNANGYARVRVGRLAGLASDGDALMRKRLTVRERYLLTTQRKVCERTSRKASVAAVLGRKGRNHRVRGVPGGMDLRVYC